MKHVTFMNTDSSRQSLVNNNSIEEDLLEMEKQFESVNILTKSNSKDAYNYSKTKGKDE